MDRPGATYQLGGRAQTRIAAHMQSSHTQVQSMRVTGSEDSTMMSRLASQGASLSLREPGSTKRLLQYAMPRLCWLYAVVTCR